MAKKQLVLTLLVTIATIFISNLAYADVWVNSYYRSDGTYVNGHYRSSPDGNPYNNWSYPGNTNPYTGVTAGGDPDAYLNNYYDNSGSSYYGGSTGSSYYGGTSLYGTSSTTPSCPLMSSYNSTTGNCECYSGYVANGTSCVSGLSYCWGKYGYNSTYSSLNNSCECDYGYQLTNGTCTRKETPTYNYSTYLPTPTPNYSLSCQQQFGTESRYNSATGKCEYCNSGYRLVGDKCYPNTTPTPIPSVTTQTIPNVYGKTMTAEGVLCAESVTYLGKTIEPVAGLTNWVNLGVTLPPCNWYGDQRFTQYHKPAVLGATTSKSTPNSTASNQIGKKVSDNQILYYRNPNWFREKLINDLSKEFGSQHLDAISRLVYTLLPDVKPKTIPTPTPKASISPKTSIIKQTATPTPKPQQNCHPSYSGCLRPDASDYDCAGGSGNGPYYTGRVYVYGSDVFGLDRDGDGIGCE